MKVKMIGEKFEVEPETAEELAALLSDARHDRDYFRQGAMPSVSVHIGRDGELRWGVDMPSPPG
ncbi:hypothetical protein [Paracoccus yeei]|uniref:hypothetical protein n=1 Tax=Paracoccus yeei TaxID=147645 RepID=UPI001747F23A|nr:hypothetical protein [Paracoccus yeei]